MLLHICYNKDVTKHWTLGEGNTGTGLKNIKQNGLEPYTAVCKTLRLKAVSTEARTSTWQNFVEVWTEDQVADLQNISHRGDPHPAEHLEHLSVKAPLPQIQRTGEVHLTGLGKPNVKWEKKSKKAQVEGAKRIRVQINLFVCKKKKKKASAFRRSKETPSGRHLK